MCSLRAVIFDMDGTLADTEEVHRQAFNQAFSEFQLDWHWSREDYKHLLLISGGRERIAHCLEEAKIETREYENPGQFAQTIHRRKSDIYREKLINGQVPLRPGVERLLFDAQENKISLAIATSSSRKNVETLLWNNLGPDALKLFSIIVTSDTVVDKKPSPAVYEYTLSKLGLHASDCIVIEDTYNGHQAALIAGIPTVITTHEYTIDDDFTGASLVLDQLGEPDKPFVSYAGNVYGHSYVDVPLLRTIYSEYNAENVTSAKLANANE